MATSFTKNEAKKYIYQDNTVRNLVTPKAYDENGKTMTPTGRILGPMGEAYKDSTGKTYYAREGKNILNEKVTQYYGSDMKASHDYKKNPYQMWDEIQSADGKKTTYLKDGQVKQQNVTERKGDVETTYNVRGETKIPRVKTTYDKNTVTKREYYDPAGKLTEAYVSDGVGFKKIQYDPRTGKQTNVGFEYTY